MKIKTTLYILIPTLISLGGKAQVIDNFSDGNFTSGPTWTGSSADWIVNNSFQLQSNNSVANSSFYISTPSTLATTAQWEFYIDLKLATSGANYADVYLTSSASDLTAIATSGYFVRIGNTTDEISLYRKDAGIASGIKIIDGTDGIINSGSSNGLKIKVTRDALNQWTLLRDITGMGNAYFSEGKITDAGLATSAFFGILIRQSSSTFFYKHFFDDIEVKQYIPDLLPPLIQSVTVISANAVDVLFNESLDISSSRQAGNYVAGSLGNAATATPDAANSALVHLTFGGSFISGFNYQLTVNDIKDLAGNSMANGTASFIFYAPYIVHHHDVVIDEIMADPTPQVGLPNYEWIELKNTTDTAINLNSWRIGDATGLSGRLPGFILKPDSFVIVCSSSASAALSLLGNVVSVTGFPSLSNTAGTLFLQSPQNTIIHSVSYTDKWYQDELKKSGGYTLEMIDTKNPCSSVGNWKASSETKGGTPGKKNANDAVNPDKDAPRLMRAYTTDSINIVLVFNEPLDSSKVGASTNFSISDGIGVPLSAKAVSPMFDRIALKLNTPLLPKKIYKVTVSGVSDCVGNIIGKQNNATIGLAEIANLSDIVINEILFNPTPASIDYVEIYNRSNKIIDLKQTFIANRNSTNLISSSTQVSTESYLLFPQDFMVVTEDAAKVKAAYIVENPDAFAEINMPSFNDDKGTAVILNIQGQVIDELTYNEKWHFNLIANREGVALERIDYKAPTQLQDNWHSAATAAGYGTPTYKNSQFKINDGVQGEVKLSPEIVSPDNDGQDDFAMLEYSFPSVGYVANITIFSASGRPVRYLQRNAVCGPSGHFSWDGLGEKGQQLATGVYIIFTEVFNLKGNKRQFKHAIVLARR
ncbi:MAG: lamin tail domain-containing protein [Ferruginibacter sp.]